MVLGGVYDGYGVVKELAFIYNVRTKAWSSMASLSNPAHHFTAVFWRGYIYLFGGSSRGSKVERILPEAGATWELVGNTKRTLSYSPVVIPYNQI